MADILDFDIGSDDDSDEMHEGGFDIGRMESIAAFQMPQNRSNVQLITSPDVNFDIAKSETSVRFWEGGSAVPVITEAINDHPLFSHITKNAEMLTAVLDALSRREIKEGEKVYVQGDLAKSVFFVEHGEFQSFQRVTPDFVDSGPSAKTVEVEPSLSSNAVDDPSESPSSVPKRRLSKRASLGSFVPGFQSRLKYRVAPGAPDNGAKVTLSRTRSDVCEAASQRPVKRDSIGKAFSWLKKKVSIGARLDEKEKSSLVLDPTPKRLPGEASGRSFKVRVKDTALDGTLFDEYGKGDVVGDASAFYATEHENTLLCTEGGVVWELDAVNFRHIVAKIDTMQASTTVDALRAVSTFRGVEDAKLHALSTHVSTEYYPQGSIIVRSGESPHVWAIQSGRVHCLRGDLVPEQSIPEHQTLKRMSEKWEVAGIELSDNQIFGSDLYDHKKRQMYTVTALSEDVFCLSIPIAAVTAVLSAQDLEHGMKRNALREIPLLQDLDTAQLSEIENNFNSVTYLDGAQILSAGSSVGELFVVKTGRAVVVSSSRLNAYEINSASVAMSTFSYVSAVSLHERAFRIVTIAEYQGWRFR